MSNLSFQPINSSFFYFTYTLLCRFYLQLPSFDHHFNVVSNLGSELYKLNIGLNLFVNEMKAQGVWDKVTVVISSDFGR